MTWVSYWMLGYFAYLEAVLGPVMPFLRDDLHLSYGIASLHFSAFAFGGVVTGALGDRVVLWLGRRLVFWGGAAGMALGALLFILSPSAVGTVAAAFLMGVLGSLLLLCIQSSLADRHGAWRAVALTEANVAASIFAILSSLVVGVVAASRLGWRMALILPLAVPLIVAIAGWHTDLGQMRPPEGHGAGPKRIPASFWAIAGVVFLETGVEWCVAYWGAGFLVASGHLSKAAAATALGAFFLAMVIGRFGGSVLMRRIRGSLLAPFVLGTLADRTGIERAFAIAIPLLLAALALAAVASGLQGSGVAARQTTTHGTPEARGTRG
jgi:MFS family permease